MFQYNYYRAQSVKDVCNTLLEYKEKAKIVAGGTDLLVQMREKEQKLKEIACLVDISFLKEELRYIKEEETCVRIGALSTHTDIEFSQIIIKYFPFLSEACKTVGSPQIRNLGTIGGSICNGSPAADPLTPLVACGARVVVTSVEGTRELDLRDLYIGKSQMDLKAGEFVTEFIVDKLPEDTKTVFVKLGRRKALAISRLNVAATMQLGKDGIITAATISPGCIFIKPDRVTAAEEILIGKQPCVELFEESGRLVSEEMIKRTGVRWSTEYKQPAIEGMVAEALELAAGLEV